MKIFNLNGDEWDRTEDREGWRSKDAWVGHHIGAELIGGSMYELEPGDKLWPFHTHHANEEWVIVLRGEPTLRTHEGEQVLREGDVVAFPRGKEGAHQIRNDTDAPIRVLMLSTRSRRTSSSTSTPARSARAASPASASCSLALGPSSSTGRARTRSDGEV